MEDNYDDEEWVEYAERPNKTQIKRDIAEVFAMAEEICALSESHIHSLELPDALLATILETAPMPHKGARKRQLKYITAQLRKLDLDAVREKLDRIKTQSAHGVREHHQAERWRDNLLSEQGEQILTALINEFPTTDRQYIRQLQRNALKEKQQQKPPKSARLLYQCIKELIAEDSE